jgi:hypothetical protein
MVINHIISIIHDIDFKIVVHLVSGKAKKATYSAAGNGEYSFSLDEQNPYVSIVRLNIWDNDNIFVLFFQAIVSYLFLPWGGVMDEIFAPFGCNFIVKVNENSPSNTVLSLSTILRTSAHSLKNWSIVAITQIIFMALLFLALFGIISVVFTPIVMWVIRFVGFVIVVWIVLLLKKRYETVYNKYKKMGNF